MPWRAMQKLIVRKGWRFSWGWLPPTFDRALAAITTGEAGGE
jgi:hypothetical protein